MINYNDYNLNCDYTGLVCDSVVDNLSHTRYNRNDDCGKKSRKACSKISDKISGSKVTLVHNCIGSSSGKKSILTTREQAKFSDSRISRHWLLESFIVSDLARA